jgi:hypothetical protein
MFTFDPRTLWHANNAKAEKAPLVPAVLLT